MKSWNDGGGRFGINDYLFGACEVFSGGQRTTRITGQTRLISHVAVGLLAGFFTPLQPAFMS